MEISIKKNKEDKVLKFVTKAIFLFDPDSNTLSEENAHKFYQYVYALSNLITVQGIKNFNDAQSIIRTAIQKSKNYSPLALNDFKSCLEEARREALEKTQQKYYFVFPLKIKYKSIKKRHFTLLGTKVKVCSYNYIQKNFSYEKLHDKKIEESLKPSRTYFVIEEYAIDEYRAGHSASEKFDLLRSIINFIDRYCTLHYPSEEPKPLSLIYPPKAFFTFDSNRTYLNKWITDITYNSREIDFNSYNLKSSKVIERSEELIKKINSLKEGGLRDLIIEAFYLHNNSLDYYDKKWLSFLGFWQILELIALSSKDNLKQDEVCKRMVSLSKEKDPYEDIIAVFKKKRNKFVHEGKLRDFTWNDINMIIEIAQLAIMFLILNAPNLKNKEGLDFFYRNVHTSEKELKTRISVLKYIEKFENEQMEP
ncbi:MAG: hypothetical protein DIAAKJNI_00186 [Candidatus Argoarchaeum ethanivorans]|uniref:Apea-like HEPN domain-containing protein n=1 Tax=Candidatus Argoarchaeum ethanivorans TaxID=2608793 RepID=A0A811T3Y4_9EURY|nr:MAG: hypothetical protein DIAAKJNI_00186 [Candidatus Argoarchaeum ethanivorans]